MVANISFILKQLERDEKELSQKRQGLKDNIKDKRRKLKKSISELSLLL